VGVLRTLADRTTNLPGPETAGPSSQKSAFNPSDRLESWKEIAAYLKREVRTVQRWEKQEGLPVHRHQHDAGHTVYAYKAEIDAWWGPGHFRLERSEREEKMPDKGLESRAGLRHLSLLWLAGAALAVAASAAAVYVLKFRQPTQLPLHTRDSVVIADFENYTGDPVFDGTLRQGLAAQLEQSPFLHIVSDQRIAGELRLMSRPAGTLLTSRLARQVCERMGGAAVMNGSIAKIGAEYNLVLEAASCSSGASLARAEAMASDKSHVLAALGSVATSMRRELGESLASIQKFNKPLAEVTTPSLKALQDYTLGWQAMTNSDSSTAIVFYRRAISLDPNFAMAYAVLGTAYSNLDEMSLTAENMKKAYDLRDRVSEREKFYISSHYDQSVTGDLLKANQVYRVWRQTYPRDPIPNASLCIDLEEFGQLNQALPFGRRTIDLAPDVGMSYIPLALGYMSLDRLDEAAAVLRQARKHARDLPNFHVIRYQLAFLEGDKKVMAREAAWAAGKPGAEAWFLELQAETAAYFGHVTQAKDLTERAVALALRSGEKEPAADYKAEEAGLASLVGDAAQARRQATAALKMSNAKTVEANASLALATAGESAQARKLAVDMAKRFPQDTMTQSTFLPTTRAAIALAENAPGRAISNLQAASPYELGIVDSLNSAYIRGLAYLDENNGTKAAAEFQKILDHPGVVINEIIAPLAHLGLARARALSGDKAGARKAYQDFFTLWKHADPDIPILQQAKAEYAKLQ
jgi:tetratricopeptide (TPR) repeat protein